MSGAKIVGLYTEAATLCHHAGYLERLQRDIGLNLVIVGFSGCLPDRVLATTPYDGYPPSDECLQALLCRHLDGAPSATSLSHPRQARGPHIAAGGDDAELQAALAQAHRMGLSVWLLGGGWTVHDFDVAMFCPAKEAVNRWYEAVYTHMAAAYGADGIDITHARYPMTSFPRGLGLCVCGDCHRAADELGYDLKAMVADLRSAWTRLTTLSPSRLAALGADALGVMDLLQATGLAAGVADWFQFRARLLERNLARFHRAVHGVAPPGFVFGVDTYPASLAMLVGHDQTRWDRFSDFASPLVSHLDIFPMQTLAAWHAILGPQWPDLSETALLRLLYRLVGYDSLALPKRLADFALGEPDAEYRHMPLADFVLLDTAKARLFLPGHLPSYPIIQGGGAPHRWPRASIERIIAGLHEQGHQGYMLQGTASLVDYPTPG
jgi:hypothetical protein